MKLFKIYFENRKILKNLSVNQLLMLNTSKYIDNNLFFSTPFQNLGHFALDYIVVFYRTANDNAQRGNIKMGSNVKAKFIFNNELLNPPEEIT